ncbi:hypothetical protein [Engelhardtia mirabilis]|uniref:Extracellular repeat protein, HAF family n=1 Tax=Engelhardtia mirabilis TaxID=2528011 RepID=A0A518BSW3_9BACT|nr:hypothetical protein Pla133_51840 [Planctomycetes bacterium Pla133]QDV04386.1 hypothetical protein Pla86_51810 [Planctomycetes bacterium Pla86]
MQALTRPSLTLFLTGLLASHAAAGDPQFELIDLGTLGGLESAAFGLNDLGQVVGWSHVPGCITSTGLPCRRGFLWTGGTLVDLGLLPGDDGSFARAINNAGLIVGTSEFGVLFGSGTFHGVTWNGAPGPVALPDLGQGQSFAHDVNESGVIAGHTQDPFSTKDRAVTWSGGAIQNLGVAESHSSNRAQGISDNGLLAGFAWELFQPNDAIGFNTVTWKTIGGTDGPFQNAEATDVNSKGRYVGFQAFNSGAWHATIWDPGAGSVVDAGTVGGFDYSELFDINEAGKAVGTSYPGDQSAENRAIYWNGSQLLDLNDMLVPGTGAHIFEAREINELGEIAGTALIDGKFRAVLLRPAVDPTWTDLGQAIGSPAQTPELEGCGTLAGGTKVDLEIRKALPGSQALIAVGLSQLNLDLGFGVLVPSLDLILGGFPVDAEGVAGFGLDWPAGIPAATELYLQAWIPNPTGPAGLTATNALLATTP